MNPVGARNIPDDACGRRRRDRCWHPRLRTGRLHGVIAGGVLPVGFVFNAVL
jgi:hypothetical protein